MWPQVRAALLAVALLANLVIALPLPKSVKRSSFDQPVAREELAHIADLVGRFGPRPSHDQIADFFVVTAKPLVALRAAITAPTKELFRLTGMTQAWGLFTYPDTFPHRLVVEARAQGELWERVYAGLDADHAFLRDVFVYRRVRGVYDGNTTKPGTSWENFSRWTADRVFEARPEVIEVRVFFERFHTVPPGGARDPEVVKRHVRTYHRDASTPAEETAPPPPTRDGE